MYALWFFICYSYVKKYSTVKDEHMDSLLFYIFIGVICGGRLGYVLLYNFDYYIWNPWEIFAIWKGGMSFHGWALGVIGMLFYFSYRFRYKIFDISDILVSILPIALWLGRIGNYINGELLWYYPYHGPLAILKDWISYFPSTLFQAFLEWIVLFSIMQAYRYIYGSKRKNTGFASGLFLFSYGILRLIAEKFRLPDQHIWYLLQTDWLTLGIIYSIPFILVGWYIIHLSRKSIRENSKYID
jgi:phosphatidylglycerol:prolipoprotein diacylglycerol transferase